MTSTSNTALIACVLGSLVAGCSQIVGFGDVTVDNTGGGDGGTDAKPIDAMVDARIDAMIDGPPPRLYTFITNASSNGGFGAVNGARTTADIRCTAIYNQLFSSKGCAAANIHAVIQVDDVVDSLARMDITFPIPQTSQILRAIDDTPVSANWDSFVNPNMQLSAPVSTSATPILFWSGRGIAGNLQCTNWTSASSSAQGNAGDATKVNSWMSQANVACNNFDQRLLCICW